jgi:excisionase family DNA binding protein
MSEPRRAPRQQPLMVPLSQLPLLRLHEAARYLRVGVATFCRSIAPDLSYVKVGCQRRWNRAELDRYIAANTRGAEHAG